MAAICAFAKKIVTSLWSIIYNNNINEKPEQRLGILGCQKKHYHKLDPSLPLFFSSAM